MLDNVQKEINGFYSRYASKEGVSLSKAKKRVKQLDIEAYERKAKKYVAEKTFTPEANEEMRLYNATMKINRLEMLKANIGLETVSGFNDLQKYFDTTLTDRTLSEFKRQAGILGKTVQDNQKLAHSIVNGSFHNARFSDRIWMYQAQLKDELDNQLQIGLIQGRNPRQLATHISKVFGARRSDAERLMQTELARVQSEAQKQSYDRNGYDQYEFIAEPTACPICRAMDGKIFDVKDMMPGENASPIHPNCRCSAAGYLDREEFDKWLNEINGDNEKQKETRPQNQYEQEKSSNKGAHYSVNWEIIRSAEYKQKFQSISRDENIQNILYKKSIDILKHREGTDYEDMHLINRFTRSTEASQTKVKYTKGIPEELKHNCVWYNDEIKRAIKKHDRGTYITVHNHAESKPPSGGDFEGAFKNGYYAGLNICHDGTIYLYQVGSKIFSGALYDATVAKYQNRGYNENEAYEATLNQFSKEYGITWRRL